MVKVQNNISRKGEEKSKVLLIKIKLANGVGVVKTKPILPKRLPNLHLYHLLDANEALTIEQRGTTLS